MTEPQDTLVERLIGAAEYINCAILVLTTHPQYNDPDNPEADICRSVVDTLEADKTDIYCIVRELLQKRVNAGFYETPAPAGNVQDNKAPDDN